MKISYAAILLLATHLGAQTPPPDGQWFLARVKRHVPTELASVYDAVAGDWSGDGLVDLVSIDAFRGVQLIRSLGRGVFVDETRLRIAGIVRGRSVAVIDVNADGVLDIVTTHETLLGAGGGFFPSPTRLHPTASGNPHSMAAGDFDGDGDTDLLIGCVFDGSGIKQDRLLRNDGSGTFTIDPTALPTDSAETLDLEVFDADGDGDLDAVLAGGDQFVERPDRLYLNDGTGHFTIGGAARFPAPDEPTTAIASGDVDGDGSIDFVTCSRRPIVSTTTWANRLWINDGNGSFVEAAASRLPIPNLDVNDVDFADLDNDGDLDLVVSTGDYQNELSRVLLNDGSGTFVDATGTWWPLGRDRFGQSVIADLDGDGFKDVYVAGAPADDSRRPRLLLGQGNMSLRDISRSGTGRGPDPGSLNFAVGDIDQDGDLDLLVGTSRSPTHGLRPNLLENDGSGGFEEQESPSLFSLVHGFNDYALADVDGDSDLDLIFATTNNDPVVLGINDGRGAFTLAPPPQMPPDRFGINVVATGDIDADGDVDLVLATNSTNHIYTNNGLGTFSMRVGLYPTHRHRTTQVELIDLDLDGDLDIVENEAGSPGAIRVLLNDGFGGFTEFGTVPIGRSFRGNHRMALGDLDGDGDPDLVTREDTARVFFNDGSGGFTDASSSLVNASEVASALFIGIADMTGDGLADLVYDTGWPDSLRVSIQVSGQLLPDPTPGSHDALRGLVAPRFADLDLDGDDDLVFVRGALSGFQILLNRARQLESVYTPRPGWRYRLEVHGIDPIGPALFMVGPNKLPAPLSSPYGTLVIDPATSALIPMPASPTPDTVRVLEFDVPNDATLSGQTFHAQAAVGPALGMPPRFTNAVFDRILF